MVELEAATELCPADSQKIYGPPPLLNGRFVQLLAFKRYPIPPLLIAKPRMEVLLCPSTVRLMSEPVPVAWLQIVMEVTPDAATWSRGRVPSRSPRFSWNPSTFQSLRTRS